MNLLLGSRGDPLRDLGSNAHLLPLGFIDFSDYSKLLKSEGLEVRENLSLLFYTFAFSSYFADYS